jgi:hypothetical protein
MRAQRGVEGLNFLFNLGVRWGLVVDATLVASAVGMNQYALYRRLGGLQGQSGHVWEISPLDHSAHSESLYQLSYHGAVGMLCLHLTTYTMTDYFVGLCFCPCISCHYIYTGTYRIAGPDGCVI